MQSALYTGRLRHRRHAPVAHAFAYPARMLWLDLTELDRVFRGRWLWSARRPAPGWLRRADYLGDPRQPLAEAVRERVRQETGARPQGPVRLLTLPRTFGFGFNPVSFYYCYDRDGRRVEAIVAEITNTPWGERHAYVLRAGDGAAGGTMRFRFAKAFHVSPFMEMEMRYDWRFSAPGERLLVHMVNHRGGEAVFDATLVLRREPLSGPALARVLARQPFAPAVVLARIYWQALRLWLKRVPFHAHPDRRQPETSR